MLETTWFVLWGLLWAIYFMLDGYALGLGALLPWAADNDKERRLIYNASGPFWDGNEVWLITAGGVTFAAFPGAYAVMFSGLYLALLLLLFTLIFRGVTFEFRSKLESPLWRSFWDRVKFLCSLLPAVLFGVAFANIFQGLPIDENGVFHGGLWALINPYGILGGVTFAFMFMVHGALWLTVRTRGKMSRRGARIAGNLWWVYFLLAGLFLVASSWATNLWANYQAIPALLTIPLLAVLCLVMTKVFIASENYWTAWAFNAATIVLVTFFGIFGMYPALLPSSIDPAYSMTITNAASSPLTLKIMLVVALVFVPIVLLYQIWAYVSFGNKIDEQDLDYEEAY